MEELTLDGTPAATEAASRAAYRKAVVAAAPGVRVLDGDVVRVEEKSTAASAEAANARARVGDRAETARRKRMTFSGESETSETSAVPAEADESRTAAAVVAAAEGSASPPAGGAEKADESRPAAPIARADTRRSRTDYVEFDETRRRLTVYGHVDHLDRHPDALRARGVIFRHPRRPSQLAAALRAIHRGMPRVVDLRFEDAGMRTLRFVDVVASAGFGRGDGEGRAPIERIHVSKAGNPAAGFTMYRALVVRRFPSLAVLDGVAITEPGATTRAARFRAAEEARGEPRARAAPRS